MLFVQCFVIKTFCYFSSVTQIPHMTTKAHPVMNKLHAHLALASASQHINQKIKYTNHNKMEFSPPSQIVGSYANFGPALGKQNYHVNSNNFAYTSNNAPMQHAPFKPSQQSNEVNSNYNQISNQQDSLKQVLPSVHPSILTPFLDQVHLFQKEQTAAEHKQLIKQQNNQKKETVSKENSSFEVINDVFSKDLVAPPKKNSYLNENYNSVPTAKPSKIPDKIKFNLSMPSPLQDASIFRYPNAGITTVPSTTIPTRTIKEHYFKPSNYDKSYETTTTEKPNVFVTLNRTRNNAYKQHKLLHPSYTGGVVNREPKPFLPTPYLDTQEEMNVAKEQEPQHSYFTIEDAVTHQIPVQHDKVHLPKVVSFAEKVPLSVKVYDNDVTSIINPTFTPSSINSVEQSTLRPRTKLRRRRPKPQLAKANRIESAGTSESQVNVPAPVRENVPSPVRENVPSPVRENVPSPVRENTPARENVPAPFNGLRNKNHTRNRSTFTTTSNVETTTRPVNKVNREYTDNPYVTEDTLKLTEETTKNEETSTEQVRHRVRLRYKSRYDGKPLENPDFKSKFSDSQLANSEQENTIKESSFEDNITTEANVVTDTFYGKTRSNYRLRNDDQISTVPPVTFTVTQPSTNIVDQTVVNKVVNRPRFSIKDFKRKQQLINLTSTVAPTTTMTTTTTIATTRPVDGQRFNRLRYQLNKKRNETNSSTEEGEVVKRINRIRTTTSTEAPELSDTQPPAKKRGSLPKRVLQNRNSTKYTSNDNEMTNLKPIIRNSTSITLSRPPTINLRQRIQNYNSKKDNKKEKETIDNDTENFLDTTQKMSTEFIATTPPTTTTTTEEYKHETSIMKIAKTPSSTSAIKSTTSNFIFDKTESSNDFDLTGSPSEHSQRVAELTVSANNDESFKSVNTGLSRRIPNYFTISTDDPQLPIMAYFPQIKTND